MSIPSLGHTGRLTVTSQMTPAQTGFDCGQTRLRVYQDLGGEVWLEGGGIRRASYQCLML